MHAPDIVAVLTIGDQLQILSERDAGQPIAALAAAALGGNHDRLGAGSESF